MSSFAVLTGILQNLLLYILEIQILYNNIIMLLIQSQCHASTTTISLLKASALTPMRRHNNHTYYYYEYAHALGYKHDVVIWDPIYTPASTLQCHDIVRSASQSTLEGLGISCFLLLGLRFNSEYRW